MAEKKLTNKEIENKLKDLKIELLKQPQKRKGIKKEIARLLTSLNSLNKENEKENKNKTQTKLEDKKQ
tara:strand:+ start:2401 stop:2604 length:204 start_codon:yes stop_codon:yes gene_type:complete